MSAYVPMGGLEPIVKNQRMTVFMAHLEILYACRNGGICIDGDRDYTCNCTVGYEGRNCELDINECLSDPCLHGGICYDLPRGVFSCFCPHGYFGPQCESQTCESCRSLSGKQHRGMQSSRTRKGISMHLPDWIFWRMMRNKRLPITSESLPEQCNMCQPHVI